MRGITASQRALTAVLSVLAVVGAFVLAAAAPARAGENTFIEVTPNSVQAGNRVDIRASCDNENNRQANVQSDAFGRIVLRPDNGFLTGSVTVPGDKQPGEYSVELRCPDNRTESTTLTVLNMAQPSKGPNTGTGGTADDDDRGTGVLLLVGGLALAAVAAGFGAFGRRSGTRS